MIKTWQVVLATVLIFLAGLITGGAIALRVVRVIANIRKQDQEQFQPKFVQQRPGYGQPELPFGPQLIRRFAGQLDLTPAQTAHINPIVRRTVGELMRLRRETQLSTALAIERMQDEIAAQLTPPQRAKFEMLLTQQRAHLQQLIEDRKARQAQGQGTFQGPPQAAGPGPAQGQGPKQPPSPSPAGP